MRRRYRYGASCVQLWRARRLAQGLCYHCGVEPHRPGVKTCASCAVVRKQKDAAAPEVSR